MHVLEVDDLLTVLAVLMVITVCISHTTSPLGRFRYSWWAKIPPSVHDVYTSLPPNSLDESVVTWSCRKHFGMINRSPFSSNPSMSVSSQRCSQYNVAPVVCDQSESGNLVNLANIMTSCYS